MGSFVRVSRLETNRRSLLIGSLAPEGSRFGPHVSALREQRHPAEQRSRVKSLQGGGRSDRNPAAQAFRRLLPFLAAAVLVCGRAAAFGPLPTPTPVYPEADVYSFFYDQNGRAGLLPAWQYPTSPTTTTELFFSDSPTTYILVNSAYFAYYGQGDFGFNSPFDLHIRVPGVGYYVGSSFADKFYTGADGYDYPPIFIIPTTSERLGKIMELSHEYYPPPQNGQAMGIGIYPSISNSVDSMMGYAVYALASNHDLNFDVTVDYLAPGSDRVLKSLHKSLSITHDYFQISLDWSGYPQIYDIASEWKIDDVVPTTTLRISIGMSGYQSDSILLEPVNLTDFQWWALLRPLPDSNSFRPTGLSFARALPSWMVPLISEITDAILHSTAGPDENQDGEVDVTDILHVLKQGP